MKIKGEITWIKIEDKIMINYVGHKYIPHENLIFYLSEEVYILQS